MLSKRLGMLSSNAVIGKKLFSTLRPAAVNNIVNILRDFDKFKSQQLPHKKFVRSLTKDQAVEILKARGEDQHKISAGLGKTYREFLSQDLYQHKMMWKAVNFDDFLRVYKMSDWSDKLKILKSVGKDTLKAWLETTDRDPTYVEFLYSNGHNYNAVTDNLYKLRNPGCETWSPISASKRNENEANIFYSLMKYVGLDYLKNHLDLRAIEGIVKDYYYNLLDSEKGWDRDPLDNVPTENYWRFIKHFLTEEQIKDCDVIGAQISFQLLTGRFGVTGSENERLADILKKMTPDQQKHSLHLIGGINKINAMVNGENYTRDQAAGMGRYTSIDVTEYIKGFPSESQKYLAEKDTAMDLDITLENSPSARFRP